MVHVLVPILLLLSAFHARASNDDPAYLVLRGCLESNTVSTGPLADFNTGATAELWLALNVDQVIESPWGPTTLFYPLDLPRSDFRISSGGYQQVVLPLSVDPGGHTLLISSGTTPDGQTADIVDLPRISIEGGELSIRFSATAGDVAVFPSANILSFPTETSAVPFYEGVNSGVVWRIDAFSDNPTQRPQLLALTLTDFIVPKECVGDLANSSGTLGPDGRVDFGDLIALLGLFGPCPDQVPGCMGDIADSNGTLGNADGQVDFGDLVALLGQFTEYCLPKN